MLSCYYVAYTKYSVHILFSPTIRLNKKSFICIWLNNVAENYMEYE